MTDPQPQVVRSYLAELDAALTGVPDGVRTEILGGVREELIGLDAASAAERIEELGDPMFIAVEAREGVSPVEPPRAASSDALWYIVMASLLVAIGGAVIPIVGWIVGIAMVWISRTWFVWEKWVATLVPVFAVVVTAVLSVASMSVDPLEGAANPLLPGPLTWWSSFVMAGLINVVVGIWLLWRARRTARPRP